MIAKQRVDVVPHVFESNSLSKFCAACDRGRRDPIHIDAGKLVALAGTNYVVVTDWMEGDIGIDFERQVEEKLNEGYTLSGGISVSYNHDTGSMFAAQALVRKL